MKRLLKTFLVTAPLLWIRCVSNDSSIHLLNAFPYQSTVSNGTCTAASVGITGGSLDISANTNYLVQFTMESTFQQLSTSFSGETPFAVPSRNDWTATAIAYSYTTVPALTPPLPAEQLPLYFRLPAGASSTSFIGLDLITASVAQRMVTSVAVGNAVQLNITIQLLGELASGQKMNTNKVTYPIVIYNTGFTGCAAGDRRVPSGPCATPGGQDGSLVGCCRNFTPPPTGC
jgi:hypothetical protein